MFNMRIENLGTIKSGKIDLKKLTIFAGENNTGKTYVSYSIYGFLHNIFNYDYKFAFLSEEIKTLREKGILKLNLEKIITNNFKDIIEEIKTGYLGILDLFFSVEKGSFEDTKLEFEFNKDELIKRIYLLQSKEEILLGKGKKFLNTEKSANDFFLNIAFFDDEKNIPVHIINEYVIKMILSVVFKGVFSEVFLLPAERAGLNLFFNELNVTRNTLIDHLNKMENKKSKQLNIMEIIKDSTSRYPQPISDYIYFLNTIEELKKEKSDFVEIAKSIQKDIINGSYKIENNNIYFTPKGSKKKLNLHMSSSAVKTFFGLVFYLEHTAKIGDFLIIDEPELNLHPDNQRIVARVIAKIVNAGINVIISTHSDYILREFNNLIMLKDEFPSKEKLMTKYKYTEEELLKHEDISAYIFKKNTIVSMEIDNKEGIFAETFDSVINSLNTSSDNIYYTKEEED